MSSAPSREFGRVLDPIDVWLQDAADGELIENLRGDGRYDMSVADLSGSCTPSSLFAAFYGPTTKAIPDVAYYFSFTGQEAANAGATLKKCSALRPWPREYDEAHHDLEGHGGQISANMIALHRSASRSRPVSKLDILDEICRCLAREDTRTRLKKPELRRVWAQISRLISLPKTQMLWVELARRHPHILEHRRSQELIRELYVDDRERWNMLAELVPRLRDDQKFRKT